MTKFYGPIGYAETKETVPGTWVEEISERTYFGDILKFTKRDQAGENLNDNLTVENRISIVADPFAYEHFHHMRFVRWMGVAWKITKVDVQRPRLILSIGGVYNEQTVGPTQQAN